MSTRLKTGMSCVAAGLALLMCSAQAGSVTYDFSTDPALDPNIQFVANVNPTPWMATEGNPGGFVSLTYAAGNQNSHFIFPDLDPGKVVTAFTVEADLRVGNGGDRPADGFSISFARSYDPIIDQWVLGNPGRGYAGDLASGLCPTCEDASMPETGSSSGIAICFDAWSGNNLPDGPDLEGIMVRVDNATVLNGTLRGFPMATRNGACDDITSMQTGPRDADFWTAGGDIYAPEGWDTLCWQHLKVELDATAKLTVTWKGNKLLDAYQTTYFPTPGRLILGGRTGGAFQQTHLDNIKITTAAEVLDNLPPTVPGNLRTTLIGARRVELAWDASVDAPDPAMRVAYNVYRDGALIKGASTDLFYTDAPGPGGSALTQLAPGSTHSYSVKAVDLSANESAAATLPVTLAAEVPVPGYFVGQIYTDVTGTAINFDGYAAGWPVGLAADPNFPATPGKLGWWLSGMSFNQPSGDWGANYGFRFAGTLTAPKSGQYRFFVRSDDASQFFFNSTGPALPDVNAVPPIAQEDGCCNAFFEAPPAGENVDAGGVGTGTFRTSAAITLNVGTKYGFVWVVKEGGGGDWGQVAWRMEGDTTAAASLPAIGGMFVEPATGGATSDPGGASAAITQDLVDLSVGANAHLNLFIAATTTSPWGYGAAYQWFKDGAPIMNANRTNYYVDVLAPADAGLYKVFVSVPGASVYTREMTLTVTADVTPPTLVAGSAHGSADGLSVTFRASEPVSAASGTYTISGGVTVGVATQVDLYTIRLATSAQTGCTEYTITVNNLRDNAGNTIAADSTLAFKSFCSMVGTEGQAVYQLWQYTYTPGLAEFVNGRIGLSNVPPTAPIPSSVKGFLTGFEMPTAWEAGGNYGGLMQGYFVPPVAGDYVFFCTSDDSSWLLLSTDANPANKVKIAFEPSWNGSRNWAGLDRRNATTPENRSDTWLATEWAGGNVVSLLANTRYYIEGVWQEGGGGDGFGATYKLASEADSVVTGASRIAGAVLQPYTIMYDPWMGAPQITQGPTPVAYAKGETITRSVVMGDGARPFTYQWLKNNTNIDVALNPSAATATLTIPNAGLSDMADYVCQVSNSAGSTSSSRDDGRAWMKGMTMMIEAEDFNYNGGQVMAAVNTMPYLGNAYLALTNQAVADVDFFANGNNADGSALAYGRFARTNGAPNFIEMKGGTPASNNDGGVVTATARFRGDFTVDANYALGWTVNGQWQNYTRTIPAGTYNVIGGFAQDGRGANAIRVDLSTVANATIADGSTGTDPIVAGNLQGVTKIGTFLSDGTGAWSSDDLIPLKTDAGAWATVTAPGGPMTFRMTSRSGPDLDYFALYLADVVPQPVITEIKVNANGTITVTWTGVGALQAATSLTPPIDWQDVAATSPATLTPPAGVQALFGRVRQ